LTINPHQEELLTRYTEAVMQASDLLHLTSEKDRPFFRARHVNDAVTMVQHIPIALIPHTPLKALDVGTGNGVPGIILSILFPEWQLDLLDSSNKKCLFIDSFIKKNAIHNTHVICDRAEFLARQSPRESYALVFSRALGKLPTALELTLPFLKMGGYLIVSHGTTWEQELKRSQNGLSLLGGTFEQMIPYQVTDQGQFFILLFKKTSPTPDRYPRNVGIPVKRPL